MAYKLQRAVPPGGGGGGGGGGHRLAVGKGKERCDTINFPPQQPDPRDGYAFQPIHKDPQW